MMAWLRQTAARFRALFRAPALDRELDAEMTSHLEFAVAENLERGLSPDEARRQALLHFGGTQQARESQREARAFPRLESALRDLRFGARLLLRDRAFTVMAVLMLALGIGANTAIFSVVSVVLLQPLPYRDAGRLVIVWEQNPHRGWYENNVSAANFLDWQKQNHVFSDLAAFESDSFDLTGDSHPEEVSGERVTTNLFSLLGVQPFRGGLFLPEMEKKGNAGVILSYGLWQERYGADPGIVGKPITIDGQPVNVVGILPASFSNDYSASFAGRSRLWVSGLDLHDEGREFHNYSAIGKLKPRVTVAEAQAEMDVIARGIEEQYPDSRGWQVALVQLHDQVVEQARPALLVLLCAVGLVLLIACANVANLLLVRATKREREIAVRAALGAGRGRIVRQLLIESTLVSFLGGALGLLLAAWASGILTRMFPPETLGISRAGINVVVLLFAAAVALATGISFGMVPALEASKTNLNETLKEGGRGSDKGAKRKVLRDVLVVSEFALALTLLFGAGLMIHTLVHLARVELGFNPAGVLAMKVPLQGPQYDRDQQKQARFYQQLIARVQALPGVEAASVARGVPMDDWAGWDFVSADNPRPPAGEVPDANYVVVGPDYFRALGIPLRAGRPFSENDNATAEPRAIVSLSLADKYWPGQNPIGKRLKIGSDPDDKNLPWLSVVGVVGNVKSQGQVAPFVPEIYVPYTQFPWILHPRHIVLRTTANPSAIVRAIREEVANLDKEVPVADVASLSEIVARRVRPNQTVMFLLGSFAALALLLAAVGIYSVISYAVTERTHEIGIRMALGADRQSVTRMVVKHGLRLTAIGVAVGLVGAFLITRLLSGLPVDARAPLLFDVRPLDPLTLLGVSTLLVVVALIACYIPARRATRVPPTVALRYE